MNEKVEVRITPTNLLNCEEVITETLKRAFPSELPNRVSALKDYAVEIAKGQSLAGDGLFYQPDEILEQAKKIAACFKKASDFGVSAEQLELARSFAIMADIHVRHVNESRKEFLKVETHFHLPPKIKGQNWVRNDIERLRFGVQHH